MEEVVAIAPSDDILGMACGLGAGGETTRERASAMVALRAIDERVGKHPEEVGIERAMETMKDITRALRTHEKTWVIDVESKGFKAYARLCERAIASRGASANAGGKRGKTSKRSALERLREEILPGVDVESERANAGAQATTGVFTREAMKTAIDGLWEELRSKRTSLEYLQEDLDSMYYVPSRGRPKEVDGVNVSRTREDIPTRAWEDVGQRRDAAAEGRETTTARATQVAEREPEVITSPTRRVFEHVTSYVSGLFSRRKSAVAQVSEPAVELTQPARAMGDDEDRREDRDDAGPDENRREKRGNDVDANPRSYPQQTPYDDEDVMPTQLAAEPSDDDTERFEAPRLDQLQWRAPVMGATDDDIDKRNAGVDDDDDARKTDSDDDYDTIAVPRSNQKQPSGNAAPMGARTPPSKLPPALELVPARPLSPIIPGGRAIKIRRRVQRWNENELRALERGIRIFGAGQWAAILAHYSDILHNRTQVDLKDKHRNILKSIASKNMQQAQGPQPDDMDM